ncbi:MAG: DNA polymerase III subunit delta, partial [Rhabdochlamydiaceae bacterium]
MQSIDKVLSNSIVFISGSDSSLLRRRYSQVRDELQNHELLEEAENYDGNSDPKTWIGAASTSPFLSSRRVVIVRKVFLCDRKRLESAPWNEVPSEGLLILVGDVDSSDPDKLKSHTTASESLSKLISKVGGLVLPSDIDPSKAVSTIQATAGSLGKKISSKASELLLDMVGGHLGDALDEVEKLALVSGNEPEIREGAVLSVVVPAREWNVFNLVDGVSMGSAPQALKQLRSLMTSPGSITDSAFRSLLPMLSRQISLLWQARIALDQKVDFQSPSPAYLELLPDKPKL